MERELVDWLSKRIPQHRTVSVGLVAVGLGDDAAVLRPTPGCETVVTTDMLMDGVDFVMSEVEPQEIGRKALAVNLSDLAAMAARPVAAFVSLALPRTLPLGFVQQMYEGMLQLAARFDVALAGGDTNTWPGPLAISVTAIGEVDAGKAWLRSGAKPGDALLVTGTLGGNILGRHLHFEPRVAEAIAIAKQYEVHAAMDISDGLSLDLARMAHASGCGAEIDLASVPIALAAHDLSRQRDDGVSPLEHALSDGEDFELLLAMSPVEAARLLRDRPLGVWLTQIGRFVETLGLFAVDHHGHRAPLVPRGYEHGSE